MEKLSYIMTMSRFMHFNFKISFQLLVCLFLIFFLSCKDDIPQKLTDEGLEVKDFLRVVPERELPLLLEEKDLTGPVKDSQQLHLPSFKTYLSDSLYNQATLESDQARIYVLGKVTAADQSVYLFIKTLSGKQKNIAVLYFDNRQQCLGRLLLLDSRNLRSGTYFSARVDSKSNFYLISKKPLPDGTDWTGERIYYFDLSGLPIMAVTNTNEDLSNQILGNPIDSFPAKHKYAGDYSTDKQNLVSVRDGRTDKTIQFFIHFSKRQGSCIGEMKGEAEWVHKSLAVFRDAKSPCVIEFRFSPKSVSIRETTGCGSYRDIKCIFEGAYPKVKKMHYNQLKSSHK
jgi:hypothetical protein